MHVRTNQGQNQTDSRFQAAQSYFKNLPKQRPPAELASYYRSLGLRAVIFDVDSESQTGRKISNDEIAEAVRNSPDVFIGFGSVDPWKGKAAVREVERCANELGMKGIKFQPNSQAFFPSDRRFYPIYEACQRLKLVTIFHTGMTGIGAGAPGGEGIRLKYSRPIPYIDDLAADFPTLTIIAAHPSWPWQEEMLAVARHKGNVFIDLSGWAPKYFPESLVHYANSLLQDKVLFGTDYPLIDPERWLKEFAELPFKEEVRKKILYSNAMRVLNLS
ncbi:MAG: amidohydrolase family protein [Nitrososphaerales archaeon]